LGGVERVDAGDALVNFVDDPRARRVLIEELAEGDDTAVTLRVAESLLRRLDETGLSTVAVGLARANLNHADWIYTAIRNVYTIYAQDRDAALDICAALMRGTDSEVSRVAELLDSAISEIEPLLRPA
jgi:hypothetical protein